MLTSMNQKVNLKVAVVSNDADVEENHMIEEIEVDEDEDLLDDMSYDDFDYSNDDNDDYEM